MKTQINEAVRQEKAEYLIKKYQSDPWGYREAITLLVDFYRDDIKDWSDYFYRRNYAIRPENSSMDYESVATTAVLYAARRYECGSEASFRTFLRYYVVGECLEFVRDTGNSLKMPRPKKKSGTPDEDTHQKYGEEQDERKKRRSISFDDASAEDMRAYESDRKSRRLYDLYVQGKVDRIQKVLEDMRKDGQSKVLKKQAKRVEGLKEHVLRGGTKKSYCDATGTSRSTLDASLLVFLENFNRSDLA